MLLGRTENLDRVDRQHRHAADPPWLADETEQPLETGPSHPSRSARNAAGQEVEGPTHSDRNADSEPVAKPVDPQLLARRAVRDQEDLRAVLVNQLQRFGVICGIRSAGVRRYFQ